MNSIVELYQYAENQGHVIYWYSINDDRLESFSIRDEEGDCAIAIDPIKLRSIADERYKLAHELGHCETGSFYNCWAACDVRGKHELRAERSAIKKLLPKKELYAAMTDHRFQWEIAEMFDVPEILVEKAVNYYDTQPV